MTEEQRTFHLEPDISLIDLALPWEAFDALLGVYVIHGEKIALIDPGPVSTNNNLIKGLAELKIDPSKIEYILATHIHLDHTGGLGSLLKLMPKARIIVHEKGLRHLIDPSRLWQSSRQTLDYMAENYGSPEPIPQDKIMAAADGMVIDLGTAKIEVFATPGHASHHLSFFDSKNGRLFAGEAAGMAISELGICLPSSPPPFNFKQAIESVDKMLALRPHTLYYAHFGSFPDAVRRLQEYRGILVLYGRIVAGHQDGDLPVILSEILDAFDIKERFYRTTPGQLKARLDFLRVNTLGFVDYFHRNGLEISSPLFDI